MQPANARHATVRGKLIDLLLMTGFKALP